MVVKVFIGGLPPSADDSSVAELLSVYGQVESVTLSRDAATLRCAGYGFAKLHSESDANRVIAALHNQVKLDPDAHPEIGPLQLRIVREESASAGVSAASNGSKPMKLFIGGVPGTATGKQLRLIFQAYGDIADLFIAPEKGYAFVKFTDQADALAAMAGVNGTTLSNAVRPLEVRIAQSTKGMDADEQAAQLSAVATGRVPTPSRAGEWTQYHTDDGKAYYHNKVSNVTQWEAPAGFATAPTDTETTGGIIGLEESKEEPLPIGLDKGPVGANIFVYGLPDRWKEREFADEFGRFGKIVSIKIIYDKATSASKGYGFISYTDPVAAEEAVASMHGATLGSRKLKVQIKRGEETGRPY